MLILSWTNKHIIDWCKSRGIKPTDKVVCEICTLPWATQRHHIYCSYRWKRKHQEDWSDIIHCCPSCHYRIHNKRANSILLREQLLERVDLILKNINDRITRATTKQPNNLPTKGEDEIYEESSSWSEEHLDRTSQDTV